MCSIAIKISIMELLEWRKIAVSIHIQPSHTLHTHSPESIHIWSSIIMLLFGLLFISGVSARNQGQVVVGGWNGKNKNKNYLSSVELIPRTPSDTCSIPDLPQPRYDHSLSLLSGGRLVVCGGSGIGNRLNSCISWVAGNASWTPFYTMRCLPIMTFTINFL